MILHPCKSAVLCLFCLRALLNPSLSLNMNLITDQAADQVKPHSQLSFSAHLLELVDMLESSN